MQTPTNALQGPYLQRGRHFPALAAQRAGAARTRLPDSLQFAQRAAERNDAVRTIRCPAFASIRLALVQEV